MVKFNKKQKKLVYAFYRLFMLQIWGEVNDEVTRSKAIEVLTLLAKGMRNVQVVCDRTNNIPEGIDSGAFYIALYFSKYSSDYKINFSFIPNKSYSLVSFTMSVYLIKLTNRV